MTTELRDQLQATLGSTYTFDRELRGGGMSRVFVAQETALGRWVVVKVLMPELAAGVSADRFRREVQFAARLQHPHILPLLNAGEAGGLLYYTMPFVEGESLRAKLAREKQLPVDDALRLAREVADALDYAHRHDILHRDIKPDNILLEDGHAVVADFGIARAISRAASGDDTLTGAGSTLGTPAYMSPEQATGEREVDGRSDIYSLGCVLYEMLAGEPPFTGPTAQVVIAKRFADPVPSVRRLRSGVAELVDAVVAKALAKLPADRFSTAGQFAEALSTAIAELAAQHITPVSSRALPRLGRKAWPRRAALAASALAVLAFVWWMTSSTPPPDIAPASQPPLRSIAVLPFVNMSADQENEYFSDGMTEELINELAQVEGLRVPSRTSAFRFKGKQQDIRTIADSLGVSAVLEGSVRRAGNRLKVTAQLINAADGYHLWSETYERETRDVFAIQEEIAEAIVRTLKVKLTGADRARLVRQDTPDPEAYNLYLKGRYHWNRRTEEALKTAIPYFEQAIAEDRTFALAHAGLGDSYTLLVRYGALPPREGMPKAKAAALAALAIDSALAEALTTLAYVRLHYDWDRVSAEREFERAVALNPGYATAHQWYARYLTAVGRFDDAVRAVRRAQDLDPLSVIITAAVGYAYYFARDYDRAIAQCRKALEFDPNFSRAHYNLGLVYEQKSMFGEAIAEFQRAVALSGNTPTPLYLAALGHAYARSGRRDDASKVLRELGELSKRRYVPPYHTAVVYVGLGETDRMFEWLKKAYDERSEWLVYLHVEPVFDSLRSNPRFADLVRRIGIAPERASMIAAFDGDGRSWREHVQTLASR
ncbi:MAG: protein kinase [Gemmatimonadaceae bacterium]